MELFKFFKKKIICIILHCVGLYTRDEWHGKCEIRDCLIKLLRIDLNYTLCFTGIEGIFRLWVKTAELCMITEFYVIHHYSVQNFYYILANTTLV